MSLFERLITEGREDLTIKLPVPGKGLTTITRPADTKGKPRVLDLKVSALWAVRQKGNPIDDDNLEDMVAKLEREGQRKPIELAWWGRKPQLQDGHHRLFAADELGWKTLKVKVDATVTDETLKALGLL